MRAVLAVLAVSVALAAAVALVSTSAAGPTAAKQRVQIDHKYPGQTFVLTPLGGGALEPDSGTQSCAREPLEREILREGQTGWIWDCPTLTFVGKRGKLVLRSRYTWIEAGGPYNIATGTWKVVSGTGQYAGLAGNGRSARVGTTSLERARYQGYVSST